MTNTSNSLMVAIAAARSALTIAMFLAKGGNVREAQILTARAAQLLSGGADAR